MEDLGHCKFCGSPAETYFCNFDNLDGYAVHCSKCGATTPVCKTLEEAKNIWNSKADLVSEDNEGYLSCPCCKGKGEPGEFDCNGKTFYCVVCDKCSITAEADDTPEGAKKFWNTRYEN